MHSVPRDLPEVQRLTDETEVDLERVSDDLCAVAMMIGQHIDAIARIVHYTDVVPEGCQWTIPVELDCDFDVRIVIRVRNAGTCARSGEPFPIPHGRS